MVTVIIMVLPHRIVVRLNQLIDIKPLGNAWQELSAQSLLVGNAAFIGGAVELEEKGGM